MDRRLQALGAGLGITVAFGAGALLFAGRSMTPGTNAVTRLEEQLVPDPPFGRGYDTAGSYVQVSGIDGLRAVDAALKSLIVKDQQRARMAFKKYGRPRPGVRPGIYESSPLGGQVSASSAVVSVLIPTTLTLPRGNDGDGWVSATLLVPSAKSVTLPGLFTDQERALAAVAAAARTDLLAKSPCVRQAVLNPLFGRAWSMGLRPTTSNYSRFALTPHGLVIGFQQGQVADDACDRQSVSIPWSTLQPLLSAQAKILVDQLRSPITRLEPPIAFASEAFASDFSVSLLYADGAVRDVGPGSSPQWIPGHRGLLVERDNLEISPPSSEIWLLHPGGSGASARKITSVYPDQVRFFTVGSHGSVPFILYATLHTVRMANVNGSDPHTIISNAGSLGSLAISRDGSQLIYSTQTGPSSGGLYIMNMRTLTRRLLLANNKYRTVSSSSWAPDGHWIAFTLSVDKGNGGVPAIWLIHPDGTDLHILTGGLEPTWSPDGDWIAYVPYELPPGGLTSSAIFKIRPDGVGRTQLVRYIIPPGTGGLEGPNW